MTIRRPSKENLRDLSDRYSLDLTESELKDYSDLVSGVIDTYDVLDQYPDPSRKLVSAIRQVGPRPEPVDDPYNGIVRTCSVKSVESVSGLLSGKKIGI